MLTAALVKHERLQWEPVFHEWPNVKRASAKCLQADALNIKYLLYFYAGYGGNAFAGVICKPHKHGDAILL